MQINVFNILYEPYIIKKPIRLIELFAGVGSQAMALRNLNADFEHYRVVEYDKHAVASYNAIHVTQFEPTDITKINGDDLGITETSKYDYILTYSFPCQDLSGAGKRQGMEKGSGTRSGLLWEVERLLNESKELPQILLMENVPEVIGEANVDHFNNWCSYLEKKGYSNYYQLLNAKDYGIPQNRNRCFMISILGDYCYDFPLPINLNLKLKDLLEENVEQKYFISNKKVDYLKSYIKKAFLPINELVVADYRYDEGLRIRKDNNCPTLTTKNSIGGGLSGFPLLLFPQVLTPKRTEYGKKIRKKYENKEINESRHNMTELIPRNDNISNTLTTVLKDNYIIDQDILVRKMVPIEYWRLMGFNDIDFFKAEKVVSNTQLYKQAGNSIVVNVLEAIFNPLLGE